MTRGKICLVTVVYLGCISLASPAESAAEVIDQGEARAQSSSQIPAIQSQTELVETLRREITQARQRLERSQAARPARNSFKYWANSEFQQAKFDADMGAWEAKIENLTSAVTDSKTRLAQEESRLDKLQSLNGGAREKDMESRRRELEREREQQEKGQQEKGQQEKEAKKQ